MKGIMKTLEAIITILMVMVAYILIFSVPVSPPDFESINLQLRAFNSLRALDANNELRSYVINNDNTTIKNKISSLIPTNVNLFVAICSSSCVGPPTNIQGIVSVEYIVAGDIAKYNPMQVIVYMWS